MNNIEIERKFLVNQIPTLADTTLSAEIVQGYFVQTSRSCLRVRSCDGILARGFVTVKGPTDVAGVNHEHEMEIPYQTAVELLSASDCPKVEKTRYVIPHEDLVIELDVFHGANEGLVLAEVELPSMDYQFNLPSWFGEEVTGNKDYSNVNLAC